MTWGAYYMFYRCPKCGKKFKYTLEDMTKPWFGKCPDCQQDGELVGETKELPADAEDYEWV